MDDSVRKKRKRIGSPVSEIWLLLIVAAVVIIVGVFLVSYQVTERHRLASVEKLRAKIGQKPVISLPEPNASGGSESQKNASGQQTPETNGAAISAEESIAAFDRLSDKIKSILDDPSWRETREILDAKGHKPDEWTKDDKAKIIAYLDANRDIILELRRLADLRWPAQKLDFSKGFEMDLPHLAKFRSYARLLATDAIVRAGAGEYEEAVKSILAGMKLANTLDDTLLIPQMVRIAINGIMLGAVETGIRGEDLPPELCNELLQYAASVNSRQSFANTFIGEGGFGLMAFDGIRNGDLSWAGIEEASGAIPERFLLRAYGSTLLRPFLNMDENAYADIMTQYNEVARLPYYQAKPAIDLISEEIQNLPFTRVLSRQLFPGFNNACEVQAVSEVRLDLMRLGLAVEQYHAQTGQYPDTLDQVAPILGGDLPIDPFTGQPYIYEPGQNTFTLYCPVGTVIDMTERPRFGADDRGNIVWRSH